MTAKTIAIAAAFSAILSLAGAAHASEPAKLTLKPLSGISFDVGAKRAVSYFLSESGRCQLTLVVADAIRGDELPTDTPVRFEAAVDAGKSVRLDTAEGKALHFACAPGTQEMSVTVMQQIASVPH